MKKTGEAAEWRRSDGARSDKAGEMRRKDRGVK
jgi:hypothetical protein